MMRYNLNAYPECSIRNVSYDDILDLPVVYPEYVIQRPLADHYLFYHVPGKKFMNYTKIDA